MATDDLKQLGIAFYEQDLVEAYYQDLRGLFLTNMSGLSTREGYILDLDSLPQDPINLKNAFIKWMVGINLPRLRRGEEPIITVEIALKCPLWKIVSPPLKRVQLTREGLFNKPKAKTAFQKRSPGSINK